MFGWAREFETRFRGLALTHRYLLNAKRSPLRFAEFLGTVGVVNRINGTTARHGFLAPGSRSCQGSIFRMVCGTSDPMSE